ncbi:MAG: 3-dehydroquinate synthase [Krumholzibacteria bacterium]|nr:3-dehydroquinate synthase [Candidatus Krumholzibacteria bacterium]
MRDRSTVIEMQLDGRTSRFILGPLAGLELPRYVAAPPPVYLVDRRVAELHREWLDGIQAGCPRDPLRVLVIEGGEGAKTPARLHQVWEWLAACRLTRDGTVVGIGGGAVLDLAGFAAATWNRGVGFVAIPTTLLAMVDAAIGGKTAVNAGGLKNPVGCFHPAVAVLADPCFLGTLSRRWWRDGMAELVKTAIIGEPRLWADLWGHRETLQRLLADGAADEPVGGVLGALPWRDWVGRAARVKADVVGRDFRESGPRRALNLGHTLGHVLEAWSARGERPLGHGEAVSVGMAVVVRVSAERGRCPLPLALQVIELLGCCGLPTSWPAPPREQLESLLLGDKKQSAGAGLRWVLPERIGRLDLDARIATDELLRWLD